MPELIIIIVAFGAALWLVIFIATLPKGVSFSKYVRRIRVARRGALADARILSTSYESVWTGSHTLYEDHRDYSLVYEVCPSGEPPFRAKGIESMDSVQAETNRIKEGATVQVRFDASHGVVVLMRVPSETQMQRYNREEAERKSRERATEEELLRDGPKS